VKTLAVALVGAAMAVQAACAYAGECPQAQEVSQTHLVGTWQARVEGEASPLTLTLTKHPEFAENVRGFLQRDGKRIDLAGDVDDGDFTLEESANGVNISATWLGEVVQGSCGREIRGTWQAEGARERRPFVLRKQ
jgi:hypothetical protein